MQDTQFKRLLGPHKSRRYILSYFKLSPYFKLKDYLIFSILVWEALLKELLVFVNQGGEHYKTWLILNFLRACFILHNYISRKTHLDILEYFGIHNNLKVESEILIRSLSHLQNSLQKVRCLRNRAYLICKTIWKRVALDRIIIKD